MNKENITKPSLAKDAIKLTKQWVSSQHGKCSLDDIVQLLYKQPGAIDLVDERPIVMIVTFADGSGVGVNREGLDLLQPKTEPPEKFRRSAINTMKILTSLNADSDDVLEKYRPKGGSHHWELVASGFWSEGMYHSGHIAYFLTRPKESVWVLDGVEQNAALDGITQKDVEEGLLNDDQLQAMWGMSLEEAQNQEYRRIVVVIEDAPKDMEAKDAAELMYAEVRKNDGKIIDEPDLDGLLEI